MKRRLILTAAFLNLSKVAVLAMFVGPEPEAVPVKQLVKAFGVLVRKEPRSAEAHYMLGRIHYFAFACGTKKLEQRRGGVGSLYGRLSEPKRGALPAEAWKRALAEFHLKEAPPYDSAKYKVVWERVRAIAEKLKESGWNPTDLGDQQEAAVHVQIAMDEFQKAEKFDPKNALYRLGSASLHEQAHDWLKRQPQAEVPEAIRTLTPKAIREGYLSAWQMEITADLEGRENSRVKFAFGPFDLASYEAGTAYVRLAEAARKELSPREREILARVRRSLKQLDGRGYSITPIIFAMHGVDVFADLLAPETVVEFPLRGWGPVDRWPWVKPDTALLVWNPSRSGRVRNGSQLFGGYTWEQFWKTGYEPLAVLDADGDGALRGPELDGLAAWFDRNSNGASDPGEVQPLDQLGVIALATHATTAEGRHPMNPRGITFAGGHGLPTWDWIAEPIP